MTERIEIKALKSSLSQLLMKCPQLEGVNENQLYEQILQDYEKAKKWDEWQPIFKEYFHDDKKPITIGNYNKYAEVVNRLKEELKDLTGYIEHDDAIIKNFIEKILEEKK